MQYTEFSAVKNVTYILFLYSISIKSPGRKQKAYSCLQKGGGRLLIKELNTMVWLNVGDP